jgi:hypothetical protein
MHIKFTQKSFYGISLIFFVKKLFLECLYTVAVFCNNGKFIVLKFMNLIHKRSVEPEISLVRYFTGPVPELVLILHCRTTLCGCGM